MKDKSKKLTVVNTDNRKPTPSGESTTQVVGGGSFGGISIGGGLDYLLKAIWDKVWEIKTDSQGNEYIFGKLPVVTQYGITMYADGGYIDLPSLYAGIPFDNKTIWLNPETQKVEVIGGTGGGGGLTEVYWDDIKLKPTFATVATSGKYADLSGLPDLSVYATTEHLTSELKKYVTIDGNEAINGLKNFTKGLQIDGLGITKSQDDVIYLDANLVVRGGITMFGTNSVDVPTIMDAIATDNVNLKVVDGVLTFVGSSGGGLTEVYWDDVIGRPTLLSSFIDDVVQGNYLPLSGGQMTGSIDYPLELMGNNRDLASSCVFDYTNELAAKGSIDNKRSLMGYAHNVTYDSWWNIISVRGDNNKYGMYIVCPMTDYQGSLYWNRQEGYEGAWQGERVILDSVNWSQYVTSVSAPSSYSYGLQVIDDRYDNPSQPTGTVSWHLKLANTIGVPVTGGLYVGLLELSSWGDWSAGPSYQIAFSGMGGDILFRSHNAGTMHSWHRLVHTGNITALDTNICGNNLGINNRSEGVIRGISLYGGYEFVGAYGICFATLSAAGFGGHGSVNRDWATYFTMDGTADRGWIFRHVGSSTNVFSIACNGNVLANGGITMYSDIRKKTKLQDVELSLKQIADAPLIEHYYNSDAMRTTHVGSIAQYWAGLNDWFCKLDGEGFYTMEIQNAALASAISIARELVKYESKTDKEIRLLKDEVKRLKKEIKILKSA